MSSIMKKIQTPIRLTVVMLVLCGLIYPLTLTLVGKFVFPHQAGGSLITVEGKQVGSKLIGQDFTDEKLMKGRPSAVNYNTYTEAEKKNGTYIGVASGSNNYAATNPQLEKRVKEDIDAFLASNPTVKKENLPADLFTASASGLDPHITVAAAMLQVPSLSQTTGLSEETLTDIVAKNTTGKFLGIFGEQTVNVLQVNIDILAALK